MKVLNFIILTGIASILSGCAGFRPASTAAAANYDPQIAVLMANFSDYAYIKYDDELQKRLAHDYPKYSILRKIDEHETGYDAQAFVAYDDDNIIIAVRGSEMPFVSADWRNNAKFFRFTSPVVDKYCPGIGIHGGFFQSALRIKNIKLRDTETLVYEEVARLQQEKGRKIYITGHSLGGAIANVLALFVEYETTLNVSGVYTYGEPKGGNVRYQECHDAKLRDRTFRFINNRDIVARVRGPGSYIHLGNLVYFDKAGNITDINTYSRWGIVTDVLTFRFVSDHFLNNYKKLVKKNENSNPFLISSQDAVRP